MTYTLTVSEKIKKFSGRWRTGTTYVSFNQDQGRTFVLYDPDYLNFQQYNASVLQDKLKCNDEEYSGTSFEKYTFDSDMVVDITLKEAQFENFKVITDGTVTYSCTYYDSEGYAVTDYDVATTKIYTSIKGAPITVSYGSHVTDIKLNGSAIGSTTYSDTLNDYCELEPVYATRYTVTIVDSSGLVITDPAGPEIKVWAGEYLQLSCSTSTEDCAVWAVYTDGAQTWGWPHLQIGYVNKDMTVEFNASNIPDGWVRLILDIYNNPPEDPYEVSYSNCPARSKNTCNAALLYQPGTRMFLWVGQSPYATPDIKCIDYLVGNDSEGLSVEGKHTFIFADNCSRIVHGKCYLKTTDVPTPYQISCKAVKEGTSTELYYAVMPELRYGTYYMHAGESQRFELDPYVCPGKYTTVKITDNGVEVAGAGTTYYDINNIDAEHEIIFYVTEGSVTTHTINASAGANGSISPSGSVTVNEGSSKTFTFTPNSGYEVDTVTVDGAAVAKASSHTFTNVTADHTINVTFKEGGSPKPTPSHEIPYTHILSGGATCAFGGYVVTFRNRKR